MSVEQDGLAWQTGVWDRMSAVYATLVDPRFVPVVEGCLRRAALSPGEDVLDLGTGTGTVAMLAGRAVAPGGTVRAVDLSPEMLAVARRRVAEAGLDNVEVLDGRAEDLPAGDGSVDVIVASLSLMYVLDRRAAARECARVLRPGGRFVAAVWAGADEADIVRFQQTAGGFAPAPPVPGVGPGALADPGPLLSHLAEAGIAADVTSEVLEFECPDFETAWDLLGAVTTANLDGARLAEAKQAVRDAMWPPDPGSPRVFRNRTHFVVGSRT